MPVRKADATWNGTLTEGNGTMRMASGAYEGQYSFSSRFEEGVGTNPEELIASAHAIDLNKQIKEWAISFFMNNASPSGVLQSKHSLSEDEYSRLRDAWNKKHRGRENAGKIAVLENDLEYVQVGSNIRDARFDFVSRELRDEILAMFGVPASKLGLVEDVKHPVTSHADICNKYLGEGGFEHG